MRTSVVFLSIFLFSALTYSFSSATEEPEPLLDEAGKKLRVDSFYYILPASIHPRGRGGGLVRGIVGNQSCSLGLVQDPNNNKEGLPVRFYPINSKKGIVRASTDLNIQFGFTESCNDRTVWKVDENYDQETGNHFIGFGGVDGNPIPEYIKNWFKVEKYRYGYKLVYCPTFCSYCDVQCKDIGIVYVNGQRRLALADFPFNIKFRKAA